MKIKVVLLIVSASLLPLSVTGCSSPMAIMGATSILGNLGDRIGPDGVAKIFHHADGEKDAKAQEKKDSKGSDK